MSWLLHVLGVDNEAGRWYAFWSGFGSDIGEVAIVGSLLAIVRKHNCHVHRCWRVGHLPVEVDGISYSVCHKHHPTGPPKAEEIRRGTR